MNSKILLPFILLIVLSCNQPKTETITTDPFLINYSVHHSIPHDTQAFTEGLVLHNGQLYESTGEHGESWIGIVNANTGVPDKKIILAKEYFGEGITILNNKIYHLTYKERTGFVYSLDTFKEIRRFNYKTEGWGLTNDGKNLIMSDGSDKLFFLDTTTLSIVKTLPVRHQDLPIKNLNELEFIDGFIYSNIWETDRIARIDAETGDVKGFLDLSRLTKQAKALNNRIDYLNGIAWHESTKSLLVTGKYWPLIYVLKLQE
jgi:glutamine cyclotransferase